MIKIIIYPRLNGILSRVSANGTEGKILALALAISLVLLTIWYMWKNGKKAVAIKPETAPKDHGLTAVGL